MKKLILMIAGLTLLGGCAQYPNYPTNYSYQPEYTQLTTGTYYSAPAYIQGQGGYIESAPNATIYYGRTAPEPVYVYPQQYQQRYYQPNYQNYQNNYRYNAPVYQQRYYQPNYSNNLGAGAGALTGGLLGATIGKGNGRVAGAAVGAGLGTVIGSGCRNISGSQIIGGLAGGLLGSTVGKGNGRIAAAAIGAAGGSMIGNNLGGGC